MVVATALKTVLHVGCGQEKPPKGLYPHRQWRVISVDLDERHKPDVVADIRDLSPFDDESVDAIFASAVLEHVDECDLVRVFSEFHRVLRMGGELVAIVPDLEAACREVLEKGANTEIYRTADDLPVRALDLIFGMGPAINLQPLMAHRTGFTSGTLAHWVRIAGFEGEISHADAWDLAVKARKAGPHQMQPGCSILYERREP